MRGREKDTWRFLQPWINPNQAHLRRGLIFMDIRVYYTTVMLIIIFAIAAFSAILYQNAENNKLYEKCLITQLEIAKMQKETSYRPLDCSRR